MSGAKLKVKIEFYASIRGTFQEKERTIELENSATVRDALNLVCNTYEKRSRIFDQSGQLKPDINILKNGRHTKFLAGIETPLEEGDRVAIFPPVHGG
jgi:molybdopterin synthase sulfur carrier subunit